MIGGNGSGNYLNSLERFDPRVGNKCELLNAMKESRFEAAASEHNGLIYVTGGYTRSENRMNRRSLNTIEMFALF